MGSANDTCAFEQVYLNKPRILFPKSGALYGLERVDISHW